MQLLLTPPVVLAALLVTGATADAPRTAADSTLLDPTAQESSQDVADVPADAPAPDGLQAALQNAIPLPRSSSCPAYLGPRCDSVDHEQWATGQSIAALGLPGN